VVRLGRPADLLESREHFEVIAHGIPMDGFPGAEMQPDGRIRFLASAAAQRAMIERIWTQGGEIVSVSPHKRSLEDLFLELTGGPGAEPRSSFKQEAP